jgi:peptidoglycan/LPS O-acetylase OafA/YrhL
LYAQEYIYFWHLLPSVPCGWKAIEGTECMTKKVYFPNLNGLRFIASMMVLFPHMEQIKGMFGLKENYTFYPHPEFAMLGVILFFVLSGFLITYLLMQEKKISGKVAIRQFYIRRLLRIWPLYYLILLLAFFILPLVPFFHIPSIAEELHHNFSIKLMLFLLFIPNLVYVAFPMIPFASQSWSVGVEEQFYLVWPWLVKKFNNIPKMLSGVIIFYFLVKLILVIAKLKMPHNTPVLVGTAFWNNFNIDCMAIGGFAAYLLFHQKSEVLGFLYSKWIQFTLYMLLLYMVVTGFMVPNFTSEIFAVVFAAIILNLAGNSESIINLENKLFNYLGKVSYGLYMYHVIAIVIAIKLSFYFPSVQNAFIIVAGFLFTILIASCSYEFFENYFIKAKVRFSKIISGDNARKQNIS